MQSLRNRTKERERLLTDIEKQLREYTRSTLYESIVSNLETVRFGLTQIVTEEAARFDELGAQLRAHAVALPLDKAALDWTLFAQILVLFKQVPDMVIFGSVLADLIRREESGDKEPSWFLNRNHRDFGTPDVKGYLLRMRAPSSPPSTTRWA